MPKNFLVTGPADFWKHIKKKGTATMRNTGRTALLPGWYVEFQAALLRQAPRPGEIDQVTSEGWTNNQESLKNKLAGCLVPLLMESKSETSLEKAREIMGKNFLGPEAVKNVFGVEFNIPIQCSEEDLERAKELNQTLILQIDKMENGKLLTLENLKAKFPEAHDGRKVWCNQDWYHNEDFFKKETPKAGWKLVSREIIPGSTNKNYLEQTEIIVNYIKEEVFKGKQILDVYQKAIDEFESQKSDIAEIIYSDWKKAADKMEKLQITRLTRENPAEVRYRLILQDQEKKEKLLPSKHTWTSGRASDGGFVGVGNFDSDGVFVNASTPDGRYDSLGVSFSRSL